MTMVLNLTSRLVQFSKKSWNKTIKKLSIITSTKVKNMKKILTILAAVAAYTIANATSIYYVDMIEVYKEFYKAKEANAQINASAETTKQEVQKMEEKRQKLIGELKNLQKDLESKPLSEDGKKQFMEKEMRPKAIEVQKLEGEMRSIVEQAQKRLSESLQRVRLLHLEEISKEVEKIAKEKKADYVLEKRSCVYVDPKFDLSAETIKRINASAPKK